MKQFVNTLLDKLGYEVRRKRTTDLFVGFHPSYLAQICQPQTVIDVGVAGRTYALHRAFPKAKFILVEPLREEYEGAINELTKKYDCTVFYKAASDTQGTQEIIVDTKYSAKSSLLERTSLTASKNLLEKRAIEVTTLDSIFRETPAIKQPILLKIDTEGSELKVLRGSQHLLQVTDTVIAEASIAKRFEESYEFEELILFMQENGFYLFSFMKIQHAIGELRPRFADVVFKRREKNLTQAWN